MICPYHGLIERGAEQFVSNLKDAIEPLGHSVDILSIKDLNIPYFKRWDEHISSALVGSFFKKFIGFEPSITQAYYSFRKMKKDYDIIWSNAEYFVAKFCYKNRKKNGTPFIVSSHSNPSRLMKTIAKLKPDLYAVLTPQYKEYLSGFDGNIKCIPPGVDLEKFKSKATTNINLEHPIFLSTAALYPNKRINLIIEAVAKLNKGSFVFTSGGPEKEKLLKLAEVKLKNRFKYLGIVDKKILPNIYNACDVYVNASRSEGLSTSVLEAMACNKPIVAQKDINRKWTVEKAGVLVNDCNDIVDFSSSLFFASKNSWKYNPRCQAEKFGWKEVAKVYDEEIRKLVK